MTALDRPAKTAIAAPAAQRPRTWLTLIGACAAGCATGWNNTNIGAMATTFAHHYGVALAEVGLFTTALFLTHMAMQVPAGRASERFGARRTALAGLAVLAISNAAALEAGSPALLIAARALMGVGTGLTFVSGSAYVRESGGSPFAQGLYGGVGLGGGGLALVVVPQVLGWLGWRAPFLTALVVSTAAFAILLACPRDRPWRRPQRPDGAPAALFGDARLYRLAVVYAASLGLSIVIGNWIVTLLERSGDIGSSAAGVVGGLTLLLPMLSRPLGGWILRAHPAHVRAAVALSLAGGASARWPWSRRSRCLWSSPVPCLSVSRRASLSLQLSWARHSCGRIVLSPRSAWSTPRPVPWWSPERPCSGGAFRFPAQGASASQSSPCSGSAHWSPCRLPTSSGHRTQSDIQPGRGRAEQSAGAPFGEFCRNAPERHAPPVARVPCTARPIAQFVLAGPCAQIGGYQ